jgi:fumarate hydratase class II
LQLMTGAWFSISRRRGPQPRRRFESEEPMDAAPDEFRIEKDFLGDVRVPRHAYYGAQTQRAFENFPISGIHFPRPFIRALGVIKLCAVRVNEGLGLIDTRLAAAIETAAQEVIDGALDHQFIVDVFQTGSGTSTNMNANEVIAGRANELLTGTRGGKAPVHPNDHVNLGQSSNDVIPTAIHVSVAELVIRQLRPALVTLNRALHAKSREFDEVVKIGRTHLMDATPIRLGQEFGGYASMLEHGIRRIDLVLPNLSELALGGTAVGTGLNTHPEFARRTIAEIARMLDIPFTAASNYFEALGARDACVETSSAIKSIAISLTKIANDIRWLNSGPRAGIAEIQLPELQPGSSIMPGKVNPVLCESLLQVAAQIVGCDLTIAWAHALGSNFELNVMMPVIAHNLLQSVTVLANASRIFGDKCVAGIQANEKRCTEQVERSLALCTGLVPEIGYDEAARIARIAMETGGTVREIAQEHPKFRDNSDLLNRLLDPWIQTDPHRAAPKKDGGDRHS